MSVPAPSNFGASVVNPTSLEMTWTNEAVYDSLQIQYTPGVLISGITGTDTTKTIAGLTENTEYTLKIRGVIGAEASAWSDPVEVQRTSLLAPSGLAASNIESAKTTLSWTNNSTAQQGIIVEYWHNADPWMAMPGIPGFTTSVVLNATGGGVWKFRIRAYNTSTSNYSAYTSEVTAGYPLPAPTGLTATNLSSSSIRLNWTDASTGETGFKIERSEDGTAYAQIDTVGAGVQTYTNTGLDSDKKYYYRVRAYDGTGNGFYSNVAYATTTTVALPTNVEVTALSSTSVKIDWKDNSNNEEHFHIYGPAGTVIATLGPNITTYTITGLTPAQWYKYAVEAYNSTDSSGLTPYVKVFTADPPKAPSNPATVVLSASSIRIRWKDNASNETGFKIEQSTDGVNFAQVGTTAANVCTYDDTGLASNTQYWYRVRAYNSSGNSGYCSIINGVTLAAIAMPTNVAAAYMKIGATLYVEVRFDDNSTEEDNHYIERDVDGGGYSALATLPADQYVYYDSTTSAGHTYSYKIRAKQGVVYSSYSAAVSVTYPSAPADPTNFRIEDVRWPDKIKLYWTPTTGEYAYEIEQSADDITYANIATLPWAGINRYTVTGLTAGTLYYFRIRAVGLGGNSDYTAVASATTPDVYVHTPFELLCLTPKKRIVHRVRVNPALELSGWALTSGKTYTYEASVDWTGTLFDGVTENGDALTETTSIALVEATAGTWYQDYYGGKIYIHDSGGDDPTNYVVIGSFWLYFTNWQRGATGYDGKQYLPLIPADGLPDISQSLQPFWKGSFIVQHGSISFINGKSPAWGNENYFDRREEAFIWENRKVIMDAGGEDFSHENFHVLATGIITNKSIDDRRFVLSLKDPRSGLHRALPLRTYSTDDFPLLYEGSAGKYRPYFYGSATGIVPVCIDTTNRIFELMDGRITSVESVTKSSSAGAVTLTVDTDYFIDYSLGRIRLAESAGYTSDDVITVAFTGAPNGAGVAIDTGALIFADVLRTFMLMGWDDIEVDSILETNASKTAALGVKMYQETTTEAVSEVIEKSCLAYSFQDEGGRIGLMIESTAVPSDVIYIPEQRVLEISKETSIDDIYAEVYVYYNEIPGSGPITYSLRTKAADVWKWKYGIFKRVPDIFSAHTTAANADTLADSVLAVLNRPDIKLTTTRALMARHVGDRVYLTRTRFFGLTGTANLKLMRIMGITKSPGAATVTITAKVV